MNTNHERGLGGRIGIVHTDEHDYWRGLGGHKAPPLRVNMIDGGGLGGRKASPHV